MLSGEGKENEDKTAHFFVHFFAVVLYDNIKLPSYAFYGGNVVRVFFCLLFLLLPLIFTLVAARISHFVTAATKFSCRSFNNKWLLISRSSSMLLFFSLSFAGRSRKQKQFPLSVFVFIGSLVVSTSKDACGYAISRQNNLELHLGCHTC